MSKKSIPKYVLNALDRREKLSRELSKVEGIVDKYCESIGLNGFDDDARIYSHILIYTEPKVAKLDTLRAINKALGIKETNNEKEIHKL